MLLKNLLDTGGLHRFLCCHSVRPSSTRQILYVRRMYRQLVGGTMRPGSRELCMTATNQTGLSDNAAGAIAYMTFVPAIVFLLIPPYNQNRYVRFHAWQSLLLNVSTIVISFLLSFVLVIFLVFEAELLVVFKRLIWVGWFVLWLICVVKALNGERFRIPILGALAEKQAEQ